MPGVNNLIPAQLLSKARDGELVSQCLVADRLLGSRSRSIRQQGIYWLRRAARGGEAWAEYMLGLRYDHGDGLPEDRKRAAYWYARAAAQKFDSAQLNLGIILANRPRPQFKKAMRLYRLAAAQGNRNAKFNLGMYYAEGRGVRSNPRLAFRWYLGAAEQGDPTAQNYVGFCYHEGTGVRRDFKESVRWYRKAARGGDARALRNLGLCYKFGDGVPRNLRIARRYFRDAAAAGHKGARRQLSSS
jgi:TPR repeat protein